MDGDDLRRDRKDKAIAKSILEFEVEKRENYGKGKKSPRFYMWRFVGANGIVV